MSSVTVNTTSLLMIKDIAHCLGASLLWLFSMCLQLFCLTLNSLPLPC